MAASSSLQQAVNQMVAEGKRARFESTFGGLDLSEFDRVAEQGRESTVSTSTTTNGATRSRPSSSGSASAALLQVKAREARQREQDLDEEAKLQVALTQRRSLHSTSDASPAPTLDSLDFLLATHTNTTTSTRTSTTGTSSLLVTHALAGMHRSDQIDERWSGGRRDATKLHHHKSRSQSTKLGSSHHHSSSRITPTTPKGAPPKKANKPITKTGRRHRILGKR